MPRTVRSRMVGDAAASRAESNSVLVSSALYARYAQARGVKRDDRWDDHSRWRLLGGPRAPPSSA